MKKITGSSLSVLKTIHLLTIVLFFGGLVASLLILFVMVSGEGRNDPASLSFILFRLNDSLVYYSFLGLTITALVYAFHTTWGIIRHRWVIIKWILLFTVAAIYIMVYSPFINGAAALYDAGINSSDTEKLFSVLLHKSFINNIILLTILSVVFFISTLKPFGRRDSDLLSDNKIAWISLIVALVMSAGFLIMGSINLNRLRNMKISNFDLLGLTDGIYKGEFNDGGGLYSVEIKITDHKISDVNLTTNRESVYIGYARPIIKRILEKQTPDVDAISGATTTSKSIMKAAENALKSTNSGK